MAKEKQDLILNITAFTERVLTLVTNETHDGKTKLISLITTAKDIYTAPANSSVVGYVYAYSRSRTLEVKGVISELTNNHDPLERFTKFRDLITKGEWTTTSFNYYLIQNIINEIPGYLPLSTSEEAVIIPKIGKQLLDTLNQYINDYDSDKKEQQLPQNEINTTTSTLTTSLASIFVSNDLNAAYTNASKGTSFYLQNEEGVWRLSWVNTDKVAIKFVHSDSFSDYIKGSGIGEVDKISKESVRNELKKACLALQKKILDTIHVQVNANNTNSLPYFIIKGTFGNYQLYWKNDLGVESELSLSLYPKLNTWLQEQKAFEAQQIADLKLYLSEVQVVKSFNNAIITKDKNELNEIFSPESSTTPIGTSKELSQNEDQKIKKGDVSEKIINAQNTLQVSGKGLGIFGITNNQLLDTNSNKNLQTNVVTREHLSKKEDQNIKNELKLSDTGLGVFSNTDNTLLDTNSNSIASTI